MENSILKSTKKKLQIGEDDTSFDQDVIEFINGAFSTLHGDFGLGPLVDFRIEDDAPVWDEFDLDTGTSDLVRIYVFLKVRLLFDPPDTAYALSAMERQLAETEWRLSMRREMTDWTDPNE